MSVERQETIKRNLLMNLAAHTSPQPHVEVGGNNKTVAFLSVVISLLKLICGCSMRKNIQDQKIYMMFQRMAVVCALVKFVVFTFLFSIYLSCTLLKYWLRYTYTSFVKLTLDLEMIANLVESCNH